MEHPGSERLLLLAQRGGTEAELAEVLADPDIDINAKQQGARPPRTHTHARKHSFFAGCRTPRRGFGPALPHPSAGVRRVVRAQGAETRR